MIFVNESCFDFLPTLTRKYQLVILDLPYNMTNNSWDQEFDLQRLWGLLDPLLNRNSVILAFGAQPFTSRLVLSRDDFKYTWVWEKAQPTGFLNAKKRPMTCHEDICVFYKSPPTYNPQMWDCGTVKIVRARKGTGKSYGVQNTTKLKYNTSIRYPRSVIKFPKEANNGKKHPTQKPVALLEYLIRTYTNEGDCVLDPTAGVASTGVAALNLKRNFDGCELSKEYWEEGIKRLKEVEDQVKMREIREGLDGHST